MCKRYIFTKVKLIMTKNHANAGDTMVAAPVRFTKTNTD